MTAGEELSAHLKDEFESSVEVLTGILFVAYEPERVVLAQSLLVVRNLLVIALPLMWLLAERYGRASSASASADGAVTGKRQTNR